VVVKVEVVEVELEDIEHLFQEALKQRLEQLKDLLQ
jgi:hypothetical protein